MKQSLLFVWFAIALLLPGLIPMRVAQDAGSADALAGLGLPTLDITITPFAYEGIPAEIAAGRYLISVAATGDVDPFGAVVDFVQPVGIGVDEFVDAMSAPPNARPEAGAPTYLFESRYAGGIGLLPGMSVQVVLDLRPGEWVALESDTVAARPPVIFTATGEMPTDAPEPASDVTLTMDEYSIAVTDGELVAGKQVIRIDNTGAQPHFILGMVGPETMTTTDVAAIFQAEMTGTPPAVGFNPDEDLVPAFYCGTQSTDTTQWIVADLAPGTYALLCFFPDVMDMLPHAIHGMYTVVEIGI